MTNPRRQPPIDYIERTRTQYEHLGYPPYSWVVSDQSPPFTPLKKPLEACTVGVVASGGVYSVGQVAFHFKDDLSVRVVAADTRKTDLRATHFAYDLTDARSDANVVFPIEQLNAMVEEGRIKAVSANAYTFMGGIYSSRKVRDIVAPAIADRLVADEVDVALMVPV